MKPALAVLLLSWVPAAAAEPRYPVKIEYDQRATMRDGVSLSADVFRPDAPGRVPVILVRTPYDNASPAYARQGLFWASRGGVPEPRGPGWSHISPFPWRSGRRSSPSSPPTPAAAFSQRTILRTCLST